MGKYYKKFLHTLNCIRNKTIFASIRFSVVFLFVLSLILISWVFELKGAIDRLSNQENTQIISNTNSEKKTEKISSSLCDIPYENRSKYKVADGFLLTEDLKSFRKIEIPPYNHDVFLPNSKKVSNRRESAYSRELNSIAYIDRVSTVENSKIDFVYIRDLSTNHEKSIYQMEEVPIESRGEYVKAITGVSFSSDSTILAITTGESMLFYHFDTDEIEKVFEEPRDPLSFGVFSYTITNNWPINGKVVINEGYYEGSGTALYDLASRTKTSLDYMSYGNGERVLGVYRNSLIVVKVARAYEAGGETTSDLYFVDVNTLEEQFIKRFIGSVSPVQISNDDVVYLLIHQENETNAYDCYAGIQPRKKRSRQDFVLSLNLNSFEEKVLLEADSLPSTEGTYRDIQFTDLLVSDDSSKEILLYSLWGGTGIKFLLNENNPNILIEIKDEKKKDSAYMHEEPLDAVTLFEDINEQRAINGTNPLAENDSVCKVARNNLSLLIKKRNIPSDEERKKVDISEDLNEVVTLVGIYAKYSEGILKAFLDSDKNYFFTENKYKYGCVRTYEDMVAFTVGY